MTRLEEIVKRASEQYSGDKLSASVILTRLQVDWLIDRVKEADELLLFYDINVRVTGMAERRVAWLKEVREEV